MPSHNVSERSRATEVETLKAMRKKGRSEEAGFSLIELLIAMLVTSFLMVAATSLLSASFNVRSREDRRSDATADVQRALNIMSRELGSSGFSLPPGLNNVARNGFVAGDANNQSVRFVANLNGIGTGSDADINDPDEDIKYLMYIDDAEGRRYIVRYDANRPTNKTTVLANRIDSFLIRYFDEKVIYTAANCDISNVRNVAGAVEAEVNPASAQYVVISVCVTLPAVGRPGAPGYQPPTSAQLTSDVTLRNAITY